MKKYVFTLVFLLYLLGNSYVFYRFFAIVSGQDNWLVNLFLTLAIAISSSIFIFYGFRNKLWVPLGSVLYKIGTGWLMLLIYAFILCVIADIVSFVGIYLLKADYHILAFDHPIRGFILIVCTVVFAALGFASYWSKAKVQLFLTTDKKLSKDTKIVFVSDLHLGYAIQNKELDSWVKLINEQEADLVLIGGDVIDCDVRPLEYHQLEDSLRQIKTNYGTFTCLGNHEYLAGVDQSIAFLEKANITVLRDKAVFIPGLDLYLIGRDDKTNTKRETLSSLTKPLDPSKMSILLDHQPYHLKQAAKAGIDLQLSGHTHKGQVWPISWITDYLFEKSHGYLKKDNTQYYVSSGLGIWGGRYRIGTTSEYVVIELSSRKEAFKK
ncbi:metallophosphoesterase [Myroides sp. LJL116]